MSTQHKICGKGDGKRPVAPWHYGGSIGQGTPDTCLIRPSAARTLGAPRWQFWRWLPWIRIRGRVDLMLASQLRYSQGSWNMAQITVTLGLHSSKLNSNCRWFTDNSHSNKQGNNAYPLNENESIYQWYRLSSLLIFRTCQIFHHYNSFGSVCFPRSKQCKILNMTFQWLANKPIQCYTDEKGILSLARWVRYHGIHNNYQPWGKPNHTDFDLVLLTRCQHVCRIPLRLLLLATSSTASQLLFLLPLRNRLSVGV